MDEERHDESNFEPKNDVDAILLQRVAAILSMRASRKRPLQTV